ncbi:MAG: DUF1844 domain-containing protein [Phycisphaerae bacterium]|nr:DUF1844 domain-containing protein [Phycisphaerae bacterium]
MPDDEQPKIIVDDDWKAEARREKEKLAQEAQKEQAGAGEAGGEVTPFLQLLDMLTQQVVLALGGVQTADGRTLPGNPQAARLFIDMIADLEAKTKGNLSKEEGEVLKSLLSRLRWAFSMQAQGGGGPPAEPPSGQAPPTPGTEKPA